METLGAACVRWRVLPSGGLRRRLQRWREGFGWRSPARSTFALHRRADRTELGAPPVLCLVERREVALLATRWSTDWRELSDAASTLEIAEVVRALVALHGWGFVERRVDHDHWRVDLGGRPPRLVPVDFGWMHWSKYVDVPARARHLAAFARLLPGDPFRLLEGEGTLAYAEASSLGGPPEAFLEAVRRAASER